MSRLLDQLAGPPQADGSRTIAERLTHQHIASHLACSRETVSRLLRDLQTGGYVVVREKRVTVEEVLRKIGEAGIIPVVRAQSLDVAKRAVEAVCAGGNPVF